MKTRDSKIENQTDELKEKKETTSASASVEKKSVNVSEEPGGSSTKEKIVDQKISDNRARQKNTQQRAPYKGTRPQRSTPRGRPYRPYDTYQEPRRNFSKANLDELTLVELHEYARILGVIGAILMRKEDLIERIRYIQAHPEQEIEVEGVLEKLPDGFGFLRSSKFDYVSSSDDVFSNQTFQFKNRRHCYWCDS